MRVSLDAPRGATRVAISSVLSIGLAVWAGWALASQKLPADGVVLIAGAAGLFAWGVLGENRLVVPARLVSGEHAAGRVRVSALAFCGAFSFLTFLLATGNRFRLDVVIAWAVAVWFYVRAFWVPGEQSWLSRLDPRLRKGESTLSVNWSTLGLAVVIAIAAFFRYFQIVAIPAEPTSDIAEKLLDVRDVLNGRFSIFFERNTGREALQFYLAVPFVHLFGLTHLALKVEQATVGLMAIPLVYLIGKEFGGARYGLLAAFFIAVSKWDVGIARVGLRFPLYPFFTALAFYFLLRALRRGTRNDFLLCGLATGVGLYGYSPFRAMVLLIPALLVVKLLYSRGHGIRQLAEGGLVCAGAAAVVFLPLARYMVERPDMFWFRAMTRMAGVESPVAGNPASVFVSNVVNAGLMFNWLGDAVWVNTVPFDPVLDFVSGGLLLLGLAWAAFSVVRDREPEAAYLLVALPILMLPSILSLSFPNENPSVVRSSGAGPIVALLVAAPPFLAMRRLTSLWGTGWGRGIALASLGALLLGTGWANYERYFVTYQAQYRQSAENSTEMAAVIQGFAASVGSVDSAYIKAYPYWVDTRNVALEIGRPDWNNVLMSTEDINRHSPPPGNKLYIIHKEDKEGAAALQRRFPAGQLRLQPSVTRGKEFLVLFVPAER